MQKKKSNMLWCLNQWKSCVGWQTQCWLWIGSDTTCDVKISMVGGRLHHGVLYLTVTERSYYVHIDLSKQRTPNRWHENIPVQSSFTNNTCRHLSAVWYIMLMTIYMYKHQVTSEIEKITFNLKLVLLERSESKSDGKFEFSMLKNPPMQFFGAIRSTSGVWQRIAYFAWWHAHYAVTGFSICWIQICHQICYLTTPAIQVLIFV